MYECLYGYTPFACEDRHNTKLKILRHKHTLRFPHVDRSHEPSSEALDLMKQILVEKEKRICSRRYELNDFTGKVVGGKRIKSAADKAHKNYEGFFVYSDDAEDIKRHGFFRSIRWQSMQKRRPPFVPRVKSWEDTKYFEDEQNISDIDSESSDVEDAEDIHNAETVVASLSNIAKYPGASSPDGTKIGSKASQHHYEDQHIVPSSAIKFNGTNGDATIQMPLLAGCGHAVQGGDTMQWREEKLRDGSAGSHAINLPKSSKKKGEKKRARDRILRDPIAGPTAMRMRKEGAFIGYSYRKPKAAEEVLKEVLEDEHAIGADTDDHAASLYFSPVAMNDYGHEKKVFLQHGGRMVGAGC